MKMEGIEIVQQTTPQFNGGTRTLNSDRRIKVRNVSRSGSSVVVNGIRFNLRSDKLRGAGEGAGKSLLQMQFPRTWDSIQYYFVFIYVWNIGQYRWIQQNRLKYRRYRKYRCGRYAGTGGVPGSKFCYVVALLMGFLSPKICRLHGFSRPK